MAAESWELMLQPLDSKHVFPFKMGVFPKTALWIGGKTDFHEGDSLLMTTCLLDNKNTHTCMSVGFGDGRSAIR